VLSAVDLSDTTVILIGDNGTEAISSEPPFPPAHAKGTVYQGGVSVPLIVAGQAVSAASRGRQTTALVQATDVFATVLEIAGAAGSARDSISLVPYLNDARRASLRPWAYTERFLPNGGPIDPLEYNRAARDARYKLVRNGTRPDELYDLIFDPFEQVPLDLAELGPGAQLSYARLRSAFDDVADALDADGDGVSDGSDNCLAAHNSAQLDSDADGFGNACDADYTNDGRVGGRDVVRLFAGFGALRGEPRYAEALDEDGDGVIGAREYLLFSAAYGKAPGPSGLACAGSVPCRAF
jgi:hypothetical protein